MLPGERVANSISTAPGGVSVSTDHALYHFTAAPGAEPTIAWRQAYDRRPARKPGQLSWGTGASPTLFGPTTGTEYVTITDSASPTENLLVYRSDPGGIGCHTGWTNSVRSAAVLKLSTSENLIYTIVRRAPSGDPHDLSLLDFYDHAVIDAATGAVRSSSQIGLSILFDSLQTAGLTTPQGVQFQETITGVVRIARR